MFSPQRKVNCDTSRAAAPRTSWPQSSGLCLGHALPAGPDLSQQQVLSSGSSAGLLEQEAEQNAAELTGTSAAPASGGAPAPQFSMPSVREALRSGGQPLSPAVRARLEPRFGHDFSRVRVHTDAGAAESAQAIDALAYTVGGDIVFRAGQYRPDSGAGMRILAHELTHVVQQGAAPTGPASVAPVARVSHAVAGASIQRAPAEPATASPGPAAAATAVAATPPQTRLPFKGKVPGDRGGWDATAILDASKIDPASTIGKAIAAGPDSVLPINKQLGDQVEQALSAQGISTLLEVMLALAWRETRRVSVAIIRYEATYGDLLEIAGLAEIMSKKCAEKIAQFKVWARAVDKGDSLAAYQARSAPAVQWDKAYEPGKKGDKEAGAIYSEAAAGLSGGGVKATTEGGRWRSGEKFAPTGPAGAAHAAAPEISFNTLKKIYPELRKDVEADSKKEDQARKYLRNLNQAFKIMKIDTVEAQANYLAHATEESGQFRAFTESQASSHKPGGEPAQHWVDDPHAVTLDPKALPGGEANPHGEHEFIGRGPVQVTNRETYVQVIAMLETMADQYAKEGDGGNLQACEYAALAREAANAVKSDPKQAANPDYAFLVSAALMKFRRADVGVSWSRPTPDKSWAGKGPEAGWVAGGDLAAGSPQAKALAKKTEAFGRIYPILIEEAKSP